MFSSFYVFQLKMYTITETRKEKKCLIIDIYVIVSVIVIHIGVVKTEVNVQDVSIKKGDQTPIVAAKHNHEPNEQTIRQKLFIAHLKEQIRENSMPIRRIFRGEIVNRYIVEPDSVRVLPQFNQIKKVLCIE